MQFSLYAAGTVNKSFLALLRPLAHDVGLVAAPSFRLASRISNSLRAGQPARDWRELRFEPVILLCAPDAVLQDAIAEFTAFKRFSWRGKTVLLCGSPMDSRELSRLRARGAATGSINQIDGLPSRFVVEGDRTAVRFAKQLGAALRGTAIEVETAKMAVYSAGLAFATSLFVPLAAASLRSLVESGPSRKVAEKIVEGMFLRSVRAYLHAGPKVWKGALADGAREPVMRELDALQRLDPKLAGCYRNAVRMTLEWFGKRDWQL